MKLKDAYSLEEKFWPPDAEAETPVLWSPHAKSWHIGKDPDAGRDWGQEDKGMTEDERAGWHHRLDGHKFELTPGVGDGQGGLACCVSWGHKESDTTERLNWDSILKSRDKKIKNKKQRHYFANKGPSSQSYGSPVVMYGYESWTIKKSWAPKNWCFWTVVLGKTLESPLDCKEIQPVHPKGDQSWVFTGRTDAEAETPVLWPPDVKS